MNPAHITGGIFGISLAEVKLSSASKKEIQNIGSSRCIFIVELRVSAILAIDNGELVVLDIKHLGQARPRHCYIFLPCIPASTFNTAITLHEIHLPVLSYSTITH